jgi:hypothetical protein
VNGYIDHLYTPLETTGDYSDVAIHHTLQITVAPTRPFPDFCLHQPLNLIASIVFFINSRRGPHRKHSSSIIACVYVSEVTCIESLLRDGHLFVRLLHSNGCTRCLFLGLCLATALYATIYTPRGSRSIGCPK